MKKGRWTTGPEYEYAYCSACGHSEYAGWDSTSEAKREIDSFADEFRFCPNCGAKMKTKNTERRNG